MLLINPIVRWAIDPSESDRIAQLPGASWPKGMALPEEDDLLTLDFLVDPKTRQPVQVRVSAVLARAQGDHTEVAILVSRPQ